MKTLFTFSLVLAMLFFPYTTIAGKAKVTVRVDGLSCPFCAYGLEKKLKKMEGVEGFSIHIELGRVEIIFSDEDLYDKNKVKEVVREAGFTPKGIKVEKIED